MDNKKPPLIPSLTEGVFSAGKDKCNTYVISSINRNEYEGGLGQIESDADSLIQLQIVRYDEKTAKWRAADKKEYAAEQTQARSYVQASVIKNRHGSGTQKLFLLDRPTQTFHLVKTESQKLENRGRKIAKF